MCSVTKWDLEQVCLPLYLCVAHLTPRMGPKNHVWCGGDVFVMVNKQYGRTEKKRYIYTVGSKRKGR